jgi:hypothetical protein
VVGPDQWVPDRAGNGRQALILFALVLVSIIGQDDLVDCALPFPNQAGAGFEPVPRFAVTAALRGQGVGNLPQSPGGARVEATVGLLLDLGNISTRHCLPFIASAPVAGL